MFWPWTESSPARGLSVHSELHRWVLLSAAAKEADKLPSDAKATKKVSLRPLSFKQALKGLLEVDPEAVEPKKAEKPQAARPKKKSPQLHF